MSLEKEKESERMWKDHGKMEKVALVSAGSFSEARGGSPQAGNPTSHQGPDARQPKRNRLERPAEDAGSRVVSDTPHRLPKAQPCPCCCQNRPEGTRTMRSQVCMWSWRCHCKQSFEQLSPPEHQSHPSGGCLQVPLRLPW